ncbi:MAG: alpha/beta hydrolase [Candidatus Obscuribacterales bacterium]|nr:alpha/beta hydrolase [Candidatus Obscuribacterales bacterium]
MKTVHNLAPVRGIAMLRKCQNQRTKVWRLLLFFFGLIALVCLSAYLFLAPIFHSDFIDSRILFPIKVPANHKISDHVGAIEAVPVKVPVKYDKRQVLISAAHYKQPKARGIVIYSHGTGGNIDIRFSKQNPRLAMLINQGFDLLLYDYQGYGRSQGRASFGNLKADCLAVYDYVLSLGYKPQQIILYGESLGGGVSCMLAKLKPVKAIILDCTFTSPERLARTLAPIASIYPDFLFPGPKLDNLQYLKGEHPPCLIITGQKDTNVPPSQSVKLKREAKPDSYLLILPNSGHCTLADCDQKLYELALTKFLKQLI